MTGIKNGGIGIEAHSERRSLLTKNVSLSLKAPKAPHLEHDRARYFITYFIAISLKQSQQEMK
jgi:hypothetical protein